MGGNRQSIQFEEGSGNVYADLKLADADVLFAKAHLGHQLWRSLQARNLTRREIAALLAIAPKDVSHLLNGHFSRFSEKQILDFLNRLK